MPATSSNPVRAIAKVCSLALLCASWAASSPAQSSVPHPPDSQKQPAGSLSHPPDKTKDAASSPGDAGQAGATIKVNVKLVNVFATVTDAGGKPVSSLK